MDSILSAVNESSESGGFLWIPLTSRDREVIAGTIEAGFEFFHASLEEKSRNTLQEECGYRQTGIEYSQSPERPDQIESFTANAKIHPAGGELPLASAQTLYERMLASLDVLEPIAEAITTELVRTVSGSDFADRLRGSFRRWSRLQLNYSRPAESGTRYIHDAHEDGSLLTLACATAPGLECQTVRGEFVQIPPSLDELFVMPGEITYLLSGGAIRPVWHRVVPDVRVQERIALLFFGDIEPALCEPWIRNKVNTNTDIGARVLTNGVRFGLKDFSAEQGR